MEWISSIIKMLSIPFSSEEILVYGKKIAVFFRIFNFSAYLIFPLRNIVTLCDLVMFLLNIRNVLPHVPQSMILLRK